MNNLKTISENLILKLEMSRQIFHQASLKVHNAYMTDAFKKLALLRGDFQKKIATISGIDMNNLSLDITDKLKVEATKIGMQIDHFYLRRNEKEVLGFCNEQAALLLSEYEQAVTTPGLEESFKAILIPQKTTIKQNLTLLQREYEGYVYA